MCLKIEPEGGETIEYTDGIPMGIRKVTVEKLGVYPDNEASAIFDYPLDELNFPASGVLAPETGTISAAGGQWCPEFTFDVQEGEECVYTMCFEGFSGDVTVDVPLCRLVKVLNKVAYFDADATDIAQFTDVAMEVSR
jgi:hypothetical protein